MEIDFFTLQFMQACIYAFCFARCSLKFSRTKNIIQIIKNKLNHEKINNKEFRKKRIVPEQIKKNFVCLIFVIVRSFLRNLMKICPTALSDLS